jgi:hypothetical protein
MCCLDDSCWTLRSWSDVLVDDLGWCVCCCAETVLMTVLMTLCWCVNVPVLLMCCWVGDWVDNRVDDCVCVDDSVDWNVGVVIVSCWFADNYIDVLMTVLMCCHVGDIVLTSHIIVTSDSSSPSITHYCVCCVFDDVLRTVVLFCGWVLMCWCVSNVGVSMWWCRLCCSVMCWWHWLMCRCIDDCVSWWHCVDVVFWCVDDCVLMSYVLVDVLAYWLTCWCWCGALMNLFILHMFALHLGKSRTFLLCAEFVSITFWFRTAWTHFQIRNWNQSQAIRGIEFASAEPVARFLPTIMGMLFRVMNTKSVGVSSCLCRTDQIKGFFFTD